MGIVITARELFYHSGGLCVIGESRAKEIVCSANLLPWRSNCTASLLPWRFNELLHGVKRSLSHVPV